VLLPDAGPLFTLAAADALDLFGAAELDVVLTDGVARGICAALVLPFDPRLAYG
jgi:hypothetical protein